MEPLQSDRPQLLGKRKREGSSEETYVASAASMDLDEDQEESEDHGPECFSKYFPTVPVNSNAITVPASGVRIIELSSDEEGNSGSAEQDIAQVIDHDSDSDVIILSARNVRAAALTIAGSRKREVFEAPKTPGPKMNASSLPQPLPLLERTQQNPFTQNPAIPPPVTPALKTARPFSFVPIAPQWLVRRNLPRRVRTKPPRWLEDFSPYFGERPRLSHPDTGDLPKYFPPLLYEKVRTLGKVPKTSDEFFAMYFDPEYLGDRAVWTRYREIEEEVWCKRWDQHPAFNQWVRFSVGYTAGGQCSQEERLEVLEREWKTFREAVELAISRGWRTMQDRTGGKKFTTINLKERPVRQGRTTAPG